MHLCYSNIAASCSNHGSGSYHLLLHAHHCGSSNGDFMVLFALAAASLSASDARSHLSAATTLGAQHQPSWTSSMQRSRLTVALPALKTWTCWPRSILAQVRTEAATGTCHALLISSSSCLVDKLATLTAFHKPAACSNLLIALIVLHMERCRMQDTSLYNAYLSDH